MNVYTCRSYRSERFFFSKSLPTKISTFKEGLDSLAVISTIIRPIRFRRGKNSLVSIVSFNIIRSYSGEKTRPLRHFVRYSKFRGNSVKRGVVIPYVSETLNQDIDYWIISKDDLAEVGLIAKENNSLGEFILSFILYLNYGKLETRLIKAFFYRHIVYREDEQFYQIQSFIIDWMNTNPSSKFPP